MGEMKKKKSSSRTSAAEKWGGTVAIGCVTIQDMYMYVYLQ